MKNAMNAIAKKLALPLAALLLAGCGKPASSTPAADARPRVLVSNPPMAWLVKQIAGDKVIVQTLAHAGGCGHEYQPTDAEMAEAGKASVWFQVGLEFEDAEWAKNLKPKLGLQRTAPQGTAHYPNGSVEILEKSSHFWMSLPHLIHMARFMDCLEHHPENMKIEAEFNQAILTRHAHLTQLLAPLKGQTFLADHPAYAYFAADYGLKQLAIEEEGHPASDAHLTDLIAQAKQAQVKVLFLAEECNRPLAETVAKAVGAKIVAADPNEENTPALLERMADELVKAHGAKP